MVSRSVGWCLVTLVAAGLAAAGARATPSLAQALTTGSVSPSGNLVWGGPVPPAPVPGQIPVYVPSDAISSERPFSAQSGGAVSAAPLGAPAAVPVEAMPGVQQAALPPLDAPQVIDDGGRMGVYGSVPEEDFDPWEGLTETSPGDEPAAESFGGGPLPPAAVAPSAPPAVAVPSYAALERAAPRPEPERRGWSLNPFSWGRGTLSDQAPTGYRSLPRGEAQCRRELQSRGVQFTDVSPVGGGRGCGIQNPVRVTVAAKGIAMQPAATLSCQTALQTARWLDDEVRPAARWRLWKRPTAILNASSYRCSRIAGSRTISEHALGNALDVRGFAFADGSRVLVEPKGFWNRSERKFQDQVRQGSCRYFGTVLGPGYNRAHDDHFHFDVKSRMRPVCK